MKIWNVVVTRGNKNATPGGSKSAAVFGIALVLLLSGAARAEPQKRYRNPLGMEFVLINPGSFAMGSPAEEAYRSPSEILHRVQISQPFYMMTTEVTLGQWWKIMGKRWIGRRNGTPDMPVNRVSWFDCTRFINRLNESSPGAYRLPTEAEWEYACRAGSRNAFTWGNEVDCDKVMFANNSAKVPDCVGYARARGFSPDRPAPVKSYPPNAWGLFDMHGNVWEWCQDWYGDYIQGSTHDPQGPDSGAGKVRRGGSFFGPADRCRSANRAHAHPTNRLNTTGFRLVWSPTEEKVRYADQLPSIPGEDLDGP